MDWSREMGKQPTGDQSHLVPAHDEILSSVINKKVSHFADLPSGILGALNNTVEAFKL